MCNSIISSTNLILCVPMHGHRANHPVFPLVHPDFSIDVNYILYFLIQDNCLAISLKQTAIPINHTFIQPFYSITIVAVQSQHKPTPRLSVVNWSEIWVADGSYGLRNIVVGNCQGQVQDYFLFACWGCDGARDHAHKHTRCAYGVLRVHRDILHPSFDQTAFPDISAFAYDMNDRWRNICPEHHLQLALVYPPGYAHETMTWYEYTIPPPIFTTEMEAWYTKKERVRRGIKDADEWELRQILEQESQLDRRIARESLDYAKNIAELCRLCNKIRTYRLLLSSGADV